MKLKTFFAVLVLFLFFSKCKSPTSPDDTSPPPPTTGTISGTVTGSGSNSAISGASVSTSPVTTTVATDSQGRYTITNVSPASYTVIASASGYIDNSVSITVTAGQTATANVVLQSVYAGSWSGTTSQGKSITFTVVDNALTEFHFEVTVSGPGGTFDTEFGTTFQTPKPISGDTFADSGTTTIPGTTTTISYTLNGTFSSPTEASGTLTFTLSGGTSGSASATWTANKT
jgi:hypothetical protein